MTIVNDRDPHHAMRQLWDTHLTGCSGRCSDVHSCRAEEYRTVTIPFDVPRALLVNNLKIMPPSSFIYLQLHLPLAAAKNPDASVSGRERSAKTTTA